jgi:RNA-directed DNA polymerase
LEISRQVAERAVVSGKPGNADGEKGPQYSVNERGKQAVTTQQRDHLELKMKLNRIQLRSARAPQEAFNNLGHVMGLPLLQESFTSLDGNKAVGTDNVTKGKYGESLESNLAQLLKRLRSSSYHPKGIREVKIPKRNGSDRVLAVSCIEDKIVQESVRRILEQIYEPLFQECSFGGRPGRSCHLALQQLGKDLTRIGRGAVLEIDLENFFGSVNREKLLEILGKKIQDPKFFRLVYRLIQGSSAKRGEGKYQDRGLPQGSILSPLLANVFLDEVLDRWFIDVNQKFLKGTCRMVRYLDDVVFTFEDATLVKNFLVILRRRLSEWGLKLNEEKTRMLPTGWAKAQDIEAAGGKIPSFSFLGFTHIWREAKSKRTGKKYYRLVRETCNDRFRATLRATKEWILKHMHERMLVSRVKQIVVGYLNYFAVNDNKRKCSSYLWVITDYLRKTLSRRSQKGGKSWENFRKILKDNAFPRYIKLKNVFP